MLGHKMCQVMSARSQTFVTLRDSEMARHFPAFFAGATVIDDVDVFDEKSIERAFSKAQPTLVINCVGVVKQLSSSKEAITSITVNSLFPHRLAELCKKAGSRLISISTDCVFAGKRGNYAESDSPDAEDLYGRSKLLGEVEGKDCLTIRTSIIGRQISGSHALIEWFLSQEGGTIKGFKNACFTGLTTLQLSEVVSEIAANHQALSGIYHVAATPISKFDLLSMVKDVFRLSIKIEPEFEFSCDRSLNGERFRRETGIAVPAWSEMINSMHQDSAPYTRKATAVVK